MHLSGIPTFAPEIFASVRQKDTLKRKQFVKGVTQIAQEGAIQIFHEPNTGMEEVIVGVVGQLQFEVLEYRLKNEYGVDIIRDNLPYEHLRWIENDEEDFDYRSSCSHRIPAWYRTSVTICCCYLQALGIFHGQRTTTKAYGCRNFQKMRKQKERDFLESLSFSCFGNGKCQNTAAPSAN